MVHLEYFLILSAIMLFIGIYGFLTRRSTLAVLISVELMLNASDINFAVFNRLLYPARIRRSINQTDFLVSLVIPL